MPTFKAVVYKHHKKEDNTWNVKIRITHNRMKRHIHTEYFLTKDDLTKSLKIKNQDINDKLDKKILEYRKACDELGEQLTLMSADQIKNYCENHKDKNEVFQLDFIKYGLEKVKSLQNEKRSGSAKNYETTLSTLKEYTGRENIDITEITASFLKAYKAWLKERPSKSKRKKGERAESLYLSAIRALHNFAKDDYNDEDRGIIRIPYSPFSKFKVAKPPVTRKRAIDPTLIKAIAALDYQLVALKSNRFNFAKDMFILSFGLIGMNSVDLFNCTKIKNGRITYNRAKTMDRRDDNAEISIKIEPEILPLVEKYKDKTGKRVFNFYKLYSTPDTFNTAINKGLKKIGISLSIDDLEFYAARHSWATIATNQCKINKYTVHSALNHVDDKMKVTDIYIDKDYSLIDKANRKVLSFVKLKCGSTVEIRKVKN